MNPPVSKVRWWGALLLPALTALVVYAQCLEFGFITADDSRYIVANPHLQAGWTWASLQWAFTAHLTGFSPYAEYWSPLVLLSRLFDASVYGLTPGGHHLTNLLFHIVNVWLVFFLARVWKAGLATAFLAALVFGLHPLNAEVVCWLSARKDLVATTFSLLTLIAYSRYARNPGRTRYHLALICFVLAMMSKPMAVPLPLLLLLIDFWPAQRGSWESPAACWKTVSFLLLEKLPFFMVAGLGALLAYFSQKLWGATEILSGISLPYRIANAGLSYLQYLNDFVWPRDLAVYYPHPGTGLSIPAALLAWAALALVTLAAWKLRQRIPALTVGWFGFVITLLPVIGLLQIGGHSHADRYMYLPMLGLILCVGAVAREIFLFVSEEPGPGDVSWTKGALAGAMMVWLLYLGWTAHAQASTWRSDLTVWRNAVERTAPNFTALYELGRHKLADQQLEAARYFLRHATMHDPADIRPWLLIGQGFARQGDYQSAWHHYLRAFELDSENPLVQAHMVELLERRGATEAASRLRRRFETGRTWHEPRNSNREPDPETQQGDQ